LEKNNFIDKFLDANGFKQLVSLVERRLPEFLKVEVSRAIMQLTINIIKEHLQLSVNKLLNKKPIILKYQQLMNSNFS